MFNVQYNTGSGVVYGPVLFFTVPETVVVIVVVMKLSPPPLQHDAMVAWARLSNFACDSLISCVKPLCNKKQSSDILITPGDEARALAK